MVNKIVKFIAQKAIEYCEKNDKVFIITGTPKDGEPVPYLIRYLLFSSKYFCIYIHRFLRSDHDGPHDHPWHFLTYIIDGKYNERFYTKIATRQKECDVFKVHINKRTAGSLAFRSPTDVHKVELDKEYDIKEKEEAPLTLCVVGPRIREWGFQKEKYQSPDDNYYYGNWVLWTDFLGIEKPDTEKRG